VLSVAHLLLRPGGAPALRRLEVGVCDAKQEEWDVLVAHLAANDTLHALSLRGLDAVALRAFAALLGRTRGLRALSLSMTLADGEEAGAGATPAADAAALAAFTAALARIRPGTLAALRLQVVGLSRVYATAVKTAPAHSAGAPHLSVRGALDALRKAIAARAAACHVQLDVQEASTYT
jgi:hypothetical protein